MVAVQGEKERSVELHPGDEAMLREPVEHVKNTAVGASAGQARDLSTGQEHGRPGEHPQHLSIERGTDRRVRAFDVHMESLASTWTIFNPCGRDSVHGGAARVAKAGCSRACAWVRARACPAACA